MAAPPIPDEQLQAAVDALATHGTQIAAAAALKMSRQGLQNRLQRAAERGLILLACGVYGNVIRILVPLTAEPAIVDEGLDILAGCLETLGA